MGNVISHLIYKLLPLILYKPIVITYSLKNTMAKLISWDYSHRERCYILKRTDGKKMKVEKVQGIMRLDEDILLEAFQQDIPKGNLCDQTMALMRVLRGKFGPKNPELQVAEWTFWETGIVRIVWMDGAIRWFPSSLLLISNDLKLVEQVATIRPKKPKPSGFLSQFEMDIMLRVEDLRAAVAGEEEDDGFYEEEDMTQDDYYG